MFIKNSVNLKKEKEKIGQNFPIVGNPLMSRIL
jgi:hypothetical protein